MTNKFKLLIWLWNRRKTSSFRIPKGGVAIVLANRDHYDQLIYGLSTADGYTDGNYSKVLTNRQTQILKN